VRVFKRSLQNLVQLPIKINHDDVLLLLTEKLSDFQGSLIETDDYNMIFPGEPIEPCYFKLLVTRRQSK
jgi:hypothetical protein